MRKWGEGGSGREGGGGGGGGGRGGGGGWWLFFFFKQKTAYEIYQCDWSSDVCSSDLEDCERSVEDGAVCGVDETGSEQVVDVANLRKVL